MNYYNENDPYAAQWLRNLIAAELIPAGHVDERSIKEVQANDLEGFTQCHFFAGIAGWSLALEIAGWPATEPVWTGSCPCQPLSCAGKQKREMDERHLWPDFYPLIAERRPAIVFGEQVASSHGLEWLDGISLDLEELDYAIGASDMPSASKGAPNIRQRLWWVAESVSVRIRGERRSEIGAASGGMQGENRKRKRFRTDAGSSGSSVVGWVANSESQGHAGSEHARASSKETGERSRLLRIGRYGEAGGVGVADGDGSQSRRVASSTVGHGDSVIATGGAGRLDDAAALRWPWGDWPGEQKSRTGTRCAVVECSDGTARRIESSSFPLAYGIPRTMGRGRAKRERMAIRAARTNRVGRLKGYGNAINPWVAAEFIAAYMESREAVSSA